MASNPIVTIDTVNIPVEKEKTNKQSSPATETLFPDIKVRRTFDIKSLARDGGEVSAESVSVAELRAQVVQLEFEGGRKLWVAGHRLIGILEDEKRREHEVKRRSGVEIDASLDTEARLPTVWTVEGTTRGLAGQLILKGLKIIGSALIQLDFLRSMLGRLADTPNKEVAVEALREIKASLLNGLRPAN